MKKKRPPPGSPRKVLGARRKATESKPKKNEKNRMEEPDVEQDPDSGYKSPPKYDKDEVVRKIDVWHLVQCCSSDGIISPLLFIG